MKEGRPWPVVVMMVAALSGTTWAQTAQPQPPWILELDLADGSHVVGTPAIEMIPVKTSFACVTLPIKVIRTVRIEPDHSTATLDLCNDDEVKGTIRLEPIELVTVFGKVSIGIEHIRRIAVSPGGSALPGSFRQGLVLHYSFDQEKDGSVVDASGKNNHGTVIDAQWVDDGHDQHGLKLDGENDHVEIPNSESLEIASALTLCTWVKLNSFGPGGYGNEWGILINKGDALWWNPAFALGYAKGSCNGRWPANPGPYPALFHVCNATGGQNGGGVTVGTETALATGKWYHLAGTYDGNKVRVYLNGKLEGSADYTGPLRPDGAPVLLGGSKLGGVDWGNHFTTDAILDEVMIFNRALTEAEVQRVYRSQRAAANEGT